MRRRWIRRIVFGLMAAAAVAAGFGVVRLIAPRARPTAAAKAVYHCPMHPTYTSDRPGDCPICNMRLVRRQAQDVAPSQAGEPASKARSQAVQDICYLHNCPRVHEGKPCPMTVVAKAGEQVTCPICGTHIADGSEQGGTPEGYAPILVSPQKQQSIGVTTARAERRVIQKTIRTVGQIANDPQLYQAQQEYLQALKALEAAQAGTTPEVAERLERLVDASRLRLRRLGLSNELIDEMAGWSGPDQSLLLADPSGRVWLYAPIYEYELPWVTIGQTIAVEVPAIAGKTLEATVRSIDPVLDPATRSARVRAVLIDPEHVLKPEMYVNASIAIAAAEVLAIPDEAVFDTGVRRIVFVDKGEGLFEPRDVTVGVKADGYTEVKSGVAEGEAVVTSGNFLIDSESRLKAALQGMAPSTGSGRAGGEHQHGQ